MALDQTILTNGKQVFAYGRAAAVAAGASQLMAEFDADSGVQGLHVRLGLSDVTAWGESDTSFDIEVAGVQIISIGDQITDLLRSVFIPYRIRKGERVKLTYHNGAAAAIVDIATVITLDE